ncbi:hypothetical protein G7Z17_g10174 [Cylindrodendrum hubeiense]|uniref:LITAF domain-containing protein n=1 Tax=Cylindrodendrum hubeiense TaxID=595255 RepID=A0A9P5GY61_9HYPO|nr:hypothetical protein G7Z17_g10174 [Cylindrodendrum hubeiense]
MEKPTPPQNSGTTQPVELGTIETQPPPTYERNNPSVQIDGPSDNYSTVPQPIHTEFARANIVPQEGVAPQAGNYPQNNLACAPIEMLQSQSAPVRCPSCGTRANTVTTPESGGFQHGVAALVCLVSCLGCIPYCISSLKDVHHKCGNCGVPLAKFHRSGRTEVLAFANK